MKLRSLITPVLAVVLLGSLLVGLSSQSMTDVQLLDTPVSLKMLAVGHSDATAPSDAARTSPEQPDALLIGLPSSIHVSETRTESWTNDESLNTLLNGVGIVGIQRVLHAEAPMNPGALMNSESRDITIYRLELQQRLDPRTVSTALTQHVEVVFAEPDYTARLVSLPEDPLVTEQWGLQEIAAPQAWEVVTGRPETVIAVIDSGMDLNHPDLQNRLWTNPGEIPGNNLDDDNNGYIDDIHGWNFADDNADLGDSTGHGTQVAGVIGAEANNHQGIAGVCWDCRLMIVKVTQSGGVANYSDIAAGVAYASDKGAEVINLSLGGNTDSITLHKAIEQAAQDAVVIAGAGNDNKSTPFYPAAYAEVLAVAGIDENQVKTSTSNYGSWVDVVAPGEQITTTFDGGSYGIASGSSMAAPFASGLAALLRTQHGGWSPALVRAHIVQTATEVDASNAPYAGQLGSGRLNAGLATTESAQPLLQLAGVTVDGAPDGKLEPGSTAEVMVSLQNSWGEAVAVEATLSSDDRFIEISDEHAACGTVATHATEICDAPFQITAYTTIPYSYDIVLQLVVTAVGGYQVTLPLTLTTVPAAVHVHGTLNTQTWTSDRTYIVDNNVGVAAGQVLTIEAGTEIRFDSDVGLTVAGTLVADGTPDRPIRFTSMHSEAELGTYWAGITFLDTSSDAVLDEQGGYIRGSLLRHTIIEYGYGVELMNAAPLIIGNEFSEIFDAGIRGNGAPGLMITGNRFIGVSTDISVWDGIYTVISNTLKGGGISAFGPALISGNLVSDAPGIGISTQSPMTVTSNRVVNCDEGVFVDSGYIAYNLVAGNRNGGLRVGSGEPVVTQNTVLQNGDADLIVWDGAPAVVNNNLIAGAGSYALRNASASPVNASDNWWGSTDVTVIEDRIYDGTDEFGLGFVDYTGHLASPVPTAPAYLTDLTLTPASPVGIESATFDLTFSAAMDPSSNPTVLFDSVMHNKSTVYSTTNSGLASDRVEAITIREDGSVWFATDQGVSSLSPSGEWSTYNSSNSGLPNNWILDVAFDREGNAWFGVNNGGVVRLSPDGVWTNFTWDNSPMPCYQADAITVDLEGNRWFGCGGAVGKLSTSNEWTAYTIDNSGLDPWQGTEIATDSQGNLWFGQRQGASPTGISMLSPDGNWTHYSTSNSSIASDLVSAIVEDRSGNMWFGHWNDGIDVLSPSGVWTSYRAATSNLLSDSILDIDIAASGHVWIATYAGLNIVSPDGQWEAFTRERGNLPALTVRTLAVDEESGGWLAIADHGYPDSYGTAFFARNGGHQVDENGAWIGQTHWRATFDFNALIPRDTYRVTVTGARGRDGLAIVADQSATFTVDYAGEITDRTAPPAPSVSARGDQTDASYMRGEWTTADPESEIVRYRYAIGSTPGSTDVINWTYTDRTATSHTGLGFTEGKAYWLSVQAQNTSGLWSISGQGAFIAGEPAGKVLLPLVARSR